MGEIVDSGGRALACEAGGEDPRAMERRIFRGMCASVALAVLLSIPLAPWRVTAGLLLGGLLSLLNHHWLTTSVRAMFGRTLEGARPKLRLARYVLRYVVLAAAVAAAAWLEVVSLPAALAGLCSFVPAALFEGFWQLYRAVFHREETD
ncbi:MAG TPA: ATP synthase subunit I [Pyrinomonadaceae bacterium]|nr:ATP synthase subunit I [Pyrinomonadaceae bacterium]